MTYQSAALRPASLQAMHGGFAFSCRHLLLMRRHLQEERARVSTGTQRRATVAARQRQGKARQGKAR